jgi:predicted Zn-dependent protease
MIKQSAVSGNTVSGNKVSRNEVSRIVLFFVIVSFSGMVFSCANMARAVGESAEEMGDNRFANALADSSYAIEKAADDITSEQEYYIGRAVGATLLTNYPIYTKNPDLTLYLNQITSALVINSPQPDIYNGYHTAILDSPEINAFASSGGHIFISRGLLECATSEDTLAAVIAHEIAHIQLQHSIKAIKSSRVRNAIAKTSSSVAGIALSELTDILNEAAEEIVTTLNNGYSQNQEFDADNMALYLLASAGYDPTSMVTMLQLLKENQPNHPGGFNKTHPAPEERIAKIQKPLQQYNVRDTRSYREARFGSAR